MKKIIISKNDTGIRLDKFLFKTLSNAPGSVIHKSLRKKKVKLNGKRVTDGTTHLSDNDVLELFINDEFFGDTMKSDSSIPDNTSSSVLINIVYEDDNIAILNKPSGMLSQDDEQQSSKQNSLEKNFRIYLYKKNEYNKNSVYTPSLCHRIDRNTAGLVIAAKNSAAHRIISEKIKLKEIRKFYICEAEGKIKPLSAKIDGYITKSQNNFVKFNKAPVDGGKFSSLEYNVIEYKNNNSLTEVELITGRTHQIRASFAHIGHPICGDLKYGGKLTLTDKTYQHLVSYKLYFDFKSDAETLNYLKQKTFQIEI